MIRDDGERHHVDRIAAHELVHRLVAEKYRSLPTWRNEGVASYLETIQVRREQIVVGLIDDRGPPAPRGDLLTSLRRLASSDPGGARTTGRRTASSTGSCTAVPGARPSGGRS